MQRPWLWVNVLSVLVSWKQHKQHSILFVWLDSLFKLRHSVLTLSTGQDGHSLHNADDWV